MKALCLIILFSIILTGSLRAETKETAQAEAILFEQPVGDAGDRLVVVRGPLIDPAVFSFWKKEALNQVAKMYEVRAEFRSAKGTRTPIGTFLHWENKQSPGADQNVYILDALIESGVVTLVVSSWEIRIWQIQVLDGQDLWMKLAGSWNNDALGRTVTQEMANMKLKRLDDHRLSLEIDNIVEEHAHTLFEQRTPLDSQLQLVRQWKK